jgi:hypothetical protein
VCLSYIQDARFLKVKRLKKCRVQEAKSPVRNAVRQSCTKGFNSGVKGLRSLQGMKSYSYILTALNISPQNPQISHIHRTGHGGIRPRRSHFLEFLNLIPKSVRM